MSPRQTLHRRHGRSATLGALALLALLFAGARGTGAVAPETPLTDGLTLERRIALGESHRFSAELAAGDMLRVVVDQVSIDVKVELLDPNGSRLVLVDGPGTVWPEDLVAIGQVSGRYTIVVEPASRKKPGGTYRLRMIGPRPATPDDALRVRAVELNQEATEQMRDPADLKRQEELRSRAAALWRQAGEPQREAETLFELGAVLEKRHRPEESLESLERAAVLFCETGTDTGRASAENEAGIVSRQLGQTEAALAHYQSARGLYQKIGDRMGQARVLANLGLLQTQIGEPLQATKTLASSLVLSRAEGDLAEQIPALLALGEAEQKIGDFGGAEHCFNEALDAAQELNDPRSAVWERYALNNLSVLYEKVGGDLLMRALDFNERYQRSLAAVKNPGEVRGEKARALNNRGQIHRQAGELDLAVESFESSLQLAREAKDREAESAALLNLAFGYLDRGEPQRAIKLCSEALSLPDLPPAARAAALEALGLGHRALYEPDAARKELEQALTLSRKLRDFSQEVHVVLDLARLAYDQGDSAKVLELIEPEIRTAETQRAQVTSEELRAGILASMQSYYEIYIDTLMGRSEPERALEISERARARTLLEVLSEAGADVRQGADKELADRAQRLRETVGARERERLDLIDRDSGPEQVEMATRRLNEALAESSVVESELRTGSPRYAALTEPQPLDLPALRSQVLNDGALLLEYWLGKEHSHLWAVTRDDLHSFELPPRDKIESAAKRYYAALTARNRERADTPWAERRKSRAAADADAERTGRALSALLLGPVARLLKDQPVLIVADGVLQYVPFQALPLPAADGSARAADPLLSRHRVVSLPSASVLAVLRREVQTRKPPERTLAVIADPVFRLAKGAHAPPGETHGTAPQGEAIDRLEDTGRFPRLHSSLREAEAIARLLPEGRHLLWTGFDASREKALSGELSRYAYIHIATHGVLDSVHPERSGLVLSLVDREGRPQNGYLRLDDVYNLRLNAHLVVLSACETALGKTMRGEGLIGLTRGFMYAGAARVVASLWSVEDLPTEKLMQSFYTHMLHDEEPPAEALRQAQLEMARNPAHAAPYYWAGFALQGEWR